MMDIIKLIILFLVILLYSLLLGCGMTKDKHKCNFYESITRGFLNALCVFGVECFVMTQLNTTAHMLMYVYLVTLVIELVIAIAINRKYYKNNVVFMIKSGVAYVKSFHFWGMCICIVLTGIIILVVQPEVIVGDSYDSGATIDAYVYDLLQLPTDPNTAVKYEEYDILDIPLYRKMSTYPVFLATISRVLLVNPLLITHIFIPILILLLTTFSCLVLGKRIFNDDKCAICMVMAIQVINFFGCSSLNTSSNMLLTHSWAVECLIAYVILPYVFCLIYDENIIEMFFMGILMPFMSVKCSVMMIMILIGVMIYELVYVCVCKASIKADGNINSDGNANVVKRVSTSSVLSVLSGMIPMLVSVVIYFVSVRDTLMIMLPTEEMAADELSKVGFTWKGWWDATYALYVDNYSKGAFITIAFLMGVCIVAYCKELKVAGMVLLTCVLFVFVGICNPLTYYIQVITGWNLQELCVSLAPLPIMTAIGFVALLLHMDVLSRLKKSLFYLISMFVLVVFGTFFTSNMNWTFIQNRYKISEEAVKVADIIANDGSAKKVVAPDELCNDLRLYDFSINLFYASGCVSSVPGDDFVYNEVNKTGKDLFVNGEKINNVPLLYKIVNNVKSRGFGYIVLHADSVDKQEAMEKYKIMLVGTTGKYDVFRVVWG